jgi:hypothetical protein
MCGTRCTTLEALVNEWRTLHALHDTVCALLTVRFPGHNKNYNKNKLQILSSNICKFYTTQYTHWMIHTVHTLDDTHSTHTGWYTQALDISSLLFKFSKAANLFQTTIWLPQTSTSLRSLRLNLSASNFWFPFTYCFFLKPVPQTAISIKVPMTDRISGTGICECPIYLIAISLSVNMWPSGMWGWPAVKRRSGIFMNVVTWERHATNNYYLWMLWLENATLTTIIN